MSHVAAKTNSHLAKNGTRWQDSYYETWIRTARQFSYVALYIEQNPVVKGFVQEADQWEHSSANGKDLITDPWPWMID